MSIRAASVAVHCTICIGAATAAAHCMQCSSPSRLPASPPPNHHSCSYAFPSLIRLMPAPLLQAARATVDSGRAARQWIDRRRQEEKSAK